MSDSVAISLETVEDLKRVFVQQFKHLVDGQKAGDGPKTGQAIHALLESHRSGCAVMLDTMAYLISTCDQQSDALTAAQATIAQRDAQIAAVEQLTADLAASREREQRLRAVGQRLYGQSLTFALQHHISDQHDGVYDDCGDGNGTCVSVQRACLDWESLAAAAPSAVAQEPRGEGV